MFEKIKSFFADVRVETKKVNYPSKDEIIGSTWVVITTTVIVSILLGFIDMGLSKIMKLFLRG